MRDSDYSGSPTMFRLQNVHSLLGHKQKIQVEEVIKG